MCLILDLTTGKDKINESGLFDYMNTKRTNKQPASDNKYVEKCEGCFENDGTCFCVVCEQILCKVCENTIHSVPINMSHER